MDNFNLSISIVLLILLGLVVVTFIGGLLYVNHLLSPKYDARKTNMSNKLACRKVHLQILKRNWTDYFWSDYMRASWIMLFLLFFIALGLALDNLYSLIFSAIVTIIAIAFIMFARKSYVEFVPKATARLKEFENNVQSAIEKEISFDGDNIQVFSNEDKEFNTKPQIFSFPTEVKKIQFPPLETRPPKQPIFATRKLEFLVLSREYFSICKGAETFNLLNPKLEPEKKKCAESKGKAGECNEYYYSQMQNVEYDGKNECIRIIFYGDIPDVSFKCKKIAPNRKPAMKALKDKLRLTERQRLRKIDEHEKYEEIKNRRKALSENREENNNENEK